jgi:hypothetical protein
MKQLASILTCTALFTVAGLAQSSGSFSANLATTQCAMSQTNGGLSGGLGQKGLLTTTVQTPNSSQTALLIRPSLVTGLYTDTKLSGNQTSATAVGNVTVYVTLDGKPVAPATNANPGVIFDSRFQQLNSNLTTAIATLSGGTITDAYLQLILSTLSAHSFDFVAPNVGGGVHTISMSWDITGSANNGTWAGCVGPGVLTVEQVKSFSQNSPIVIQ